MKGFFLSTVDKHTTQESIPPPPIHEKTQTRKRAKPVIINSSVTCNFSGGELSSDSIEERDKAYT